jgi:hypothetical protein
MNAFRLSAVGFSTTVVLTTARSLRQPGAVVSRQQGLKVPAIKSAGEAITK